jgi:hypothetical protein
MSILDKYVTEAPDPQLAVDLFQGTWSVSFPPPLEHIQAGSIPLFTDQRMLWANEVLGGFTDKTVIELGPLEAAQSYLAQKYGASEVLAIESNSTAYLKCLIVKELFELNKVRFLFGDFMPYLRTNQRMYDICIASGVLYHMRYPAEMLGLVARAADRVLLWTHYFDEEIIKHHPYVAARHRGGDIAANYAGFQHVLRRQEYQTSLDWSGFCGGSAPYSYWMRRDEILACLEYFGFDELHVDFDAKDHHGGPAFAVAAIRNDPTRRPTFDPLTTVYQFDDPLDLPPVAPAVSTAPVAVVSTPDNAQMHSYVAHLEQTLDQKQAYITALEQRLSQIEHSPLLRILRRFGR